MRGFRFMDVEYRDGEEYKASKSNINQIVDNVTNEVIKSFSGVGNTRKIRVMNNVIAFVGAAGGVGTSTILANVAHKVSKKGLSVLVIDANILYPIQHTFFGVKEELEAKDLISFLMGANQIGDSIKGVTSNLSLMFANNRYLTDSINCDNQVCAENFTDTIDRIKHLFDLILIDCPMDVGHHIYNSILYNCDIIYSVWDEGLSCISNIDRFRKNLQMCGIESTYKLRVIFNKKTKVHYTKYIFDQLDVDLIGTLPFDIAIIESSLAGEIFIDKGSSLSKTATAFANEIGNITDKILEIGGYKE